MKRNLFARVALAGLAFLSATSVPVTAQGPNGYYVYDWTYYSDASKTEVVGRLVDNCAAPAEQWGEVTAYYDRTPIGHWSNSTGCTMY